MEFAATTARSPLRGLARRHPRAPEGSYEAARPRGRTGMKCTPFPAERGEGAGGRGPAAACAGLRSFTELQQ